MKILVWDLPTRLFHWLFAIAVSVAWLTGDPDRYRDVHVFVGYLMLGLLLFRVIWGVSGSRYARFRSFCFNPIQALHYLLGAVARTSPRYVGHNPAGAWAIYLMLMLALLIGISGILVLGGEEQQGMLGGITLYRGGELFKELHETLASLMLGLIIIHVLGVAAESWLHHENLVKAMFTGRKEGSPDAEIKSAHYGAGVLLFGLVALFSVGYFHGYFTQTPERPLLPFIGKTLPDNKLWRAECGSCHLAYHPVLLPARSWASIMQRQNDHFGESLGIDTVTVDEILAFLRKYSAEAELSEAAYKIRKSIPPGAMPLRITETGYWINKHREIPDRVWRDSKVGSKGNCAACHLDAEKGTFEDAAMRMPKGAGG